MRLGKVCADRNQGAHSRSPQPIVQTQVSTVRPSGTGRRLAPTRSVDYQVPQILFKAHQRVVWARELERSQTRMQANIDTGPKKWTRRQPDRTHFHRSEEHAKISRPCERGKKSRKTSPSWNESKVAVAMRYRRDDLAASGRTASVGASKL